MNTISTEILLILGLFTVNGLLAMTELAVVSSRKAILKRRAEAGDKLAMSALKLAESPGDFLSTVQVGITLTGLLAGALGGKLVDGLHHTLAQLPVLATVAGPTAFFLVMAMLTYTSLILGELVPKRLALLQPEAIARWMSPLMAGLAAVAAPAVRLLSLSSEAVLRLIRAPIKNESSVTDEEVKLLIDEGLNSGTFRQDEKEMVEGVLELDRQEVGDLMTPRGRMVWINISDPFEVTLKTITESGHSNFPVFEHSRDQVLGLLSVKALLNMYASGGPIDIRSLLVQPHIVPETMSGHRLIEEFRKAGRHIALVTDEYGGISGLITLNDLLEAIVGDLNQPEAINKPQAVRRDDGSYLIDAGIYVEDVKELLGIDEFPDEEGAEYHSLGGFVVDHLGHIPTEGEWFEHGGCRFEVVDMDRHRIDKV
ncbi:MAG: hemolysin family protein, partial [Verrucomicrobiia bacterium]